MSQPMQMPPPFCLPAAEPYNDLRAQGPSIPAAEPGAYPDQGPNMTAMPERPTSPEELFDPIHHYGNEFGQEAYLRAKSGLHVIDVLEEFELNQHRSHAVEYLLRAGKKGDVVADLRKALWWINRELARLDAAK